MPIARFLAHVNDPAPGFACHICDDPKETLGWTARVTNHPNGPASASSITLLRELLGPHAAPFEELYRAHDGMLLYEDVNLEVLPPSPNYSGRYFRAAGIEFYSIGDWQSRSKSVFDNPHSLGWEAAEIAKWRHSSLVFGEICHSGNYFAVRTRGADAGSIYYLQHDPFMEGPIAANLEALLDRVVADPAGFLESMGCYTSYHDGRTDKQWLPKIYYPDVGA